MSKNQQKNIETQEELSEVLLPDFANLSFPVTFGTMLYLTVPSVEEEDAFAEADVEDFNTPEFLMLCIKVAFCLFASTFTAPSPVNLVIIFR